MKPIIAFDPALFAVPNSARNSSEAEAILNRIIEWARVAEVQNCSRFAIPANTVAVLQEANCFPATHHIKALLEMFDLDHVFSANDINARAFSLIQRSERLAGAIGIDVFETSEADCTDIEFSTSPSPVISLATLHLLASVCASEIPRMVRVVLGFPFCQSPVSFIGTITNAEIGSVDVGAGADVAGDVHVITSADEYLPSLDAETIWEYAENELELYMAVSLEAAELATRTASRLPLGFVQPFVVGREFAMSIRQNEAFGTQRFAGVVRQRCAQIVLGITSPSAFGEVRAADGAKSFRVHIGKTHVALRLMFWRRPSGVIEFANVGPKAELIIMAGDHVHRAICQFN